MKKLAFLAVGALVFLNASFAENVIPSKISQVTLFSNQAQVTRTAETEVSKGLNTLLIEASAFNLDKDSVSAKVFGEGKIYSVQFRKIYIKYAPQDKINSLEKKLKKLTDQKNNLSAKKDVLNKKKEFLNSLVDFSRSELPKEMKTSFPDTGDLNKTLDFLGSKFDSINQAESELNLNLYDLNKEIAVLKKEISSLSGNPAEKSKGVIEVVFNSAKSQKIRIEAGYLAYNAYWKPFYKIDVPLDLKEADLTMFSKIQQRTGEDWDSISLSLSNTVPLRGLTIPKLNSWTLNTRRVHKKSWNEKTLDFVGRDKGMGSGKMENAVSPRDAKFAQAFKKELPFSFEYDLPQALTIESQDKETLLPLFSKTLKGEFYYYSVPQVSPLTLVICQVKPDKELLPGSLNVYFGGRFSGKTYLREKKAGQDFRVNLGVDRNVKVRREKIKDKVKETFFKKIDRKTVIRDMAFKITAENFRNKPVNIKILDNLPVSETDRIEVKNLKVTPFPKEKNFEDKEGVSLWEFNLKPGQKKEINIEFTVTYPKGARVFGL